MTHLARMWKPSATALACCLLVGLASAPGLAAEAAKPSKLVITKAVYGDLPSGGSVDVTKKVAEMVKDGALTVDATNDNFTDPAEGVGKKLLVEYTLGGMPQAKAVGENETLMILASETPITLAIVKAVYGDLLSGDSVDVTKKVAEAAKNNALSVDATNDNFTDPAEGVFKKLRVDFTINGKALSKTVDENATLTISAADLPMVGKLVVTKAVYGELPGGASVDVTKKVAEMVKDDSLSVDATNDNFTDPAEGVRKKLLVEYTIGGVAACKIVGEDENLSVSGKAQKLVIVKAVYGDLPSGESVDVTKKVAEMVKDGVLSVDATNENFTDPAEGIVKKLQVDYTFNGAAKSKSVEENETLTISASGE